jgi:hypothetical protein
MSLFQERDFVSHSGVTLSWKIDCDSLYDEDIETLAGIISSRHGFKKVIGIPSGGDRLAEALKKYEDPELWSTLIVDDVMTTSASMEEARIAVGQEGRHRVMGVVLFSRMPAEDCPPWIKPLFQVWSLEDPAWLQKTIEKDMKSREKI